MNTDTAQTNTCTNRIDSFLVRGNGNLRACTWLTCDRFDFDHAIENLRDLYFKQSPKKIRMSSRDDNFRSSNRTTDLNHEKLKLLTRTVPLKRGLLCGGHHSFSFTKIHCHPTGFNSLNSRCKDFSFFIDKLLKYDVALSLTKALHDHLFCSLSRYSPRVVFELASFDDVTNHSSLLKILCITGSQLHERVFDLLNDMPHGTNNNVPINGIHFNNYILTLSGWITFISGRERSFNSLYNNRLRKITFSSELGNCQQQITLQLIPPSHTFGRH